MASFGFDGSGQADQSGRVGGGRVDSHQVVAELPIEDGERLGQNLAMIRIVGIVGKPNQDPGSVTRRAPKRLGRGQFRVAVQDGVAPLECGGQLGIGAADFRWSLRIDIEIKPSQADDVCVA